jgi:hypothetical protein
MDQQSLRNWEERRARRLTTAASLANVRSEVFVLERQTTPIYQRVYGYNYKNIVDFTGNEYSPIDCATGKIKPQTPPSDKNCPENVVNRFKYEQPDICIKFQNEKDLEKMKLPDIFYDLVSDPCKNSRFSMYKGRANINSFASFDFRHYSRLVNTDDLIGETIFQFLDPFIRPKTKIFLQALDQNIWGISVFLLSKIGSDNNPIVMCSRLDEAKEEHKIIIDSTTKPTKISIYNKINGIKFVDKNLMCPFCKSPPNQKGCCCNNVEIEEYLSFDLEKNCVFTDRIFIHNLTDNLLPYITNNFKVQSAAQPIDLNQLKIVVVNNSPPSISGCYTKQVADLYYYGSPISYSGIVSAQPQSDHAEKIISLYQGLYKMQPTIVIKKAGESRVISPTDLNNATGNVLNNSTLPNRKYIIGTFLNLLIELVTDKNILIKLICAYNPNIINVAAIILANKALERKIGAFSANHTLTFNLDAQAIELKNEYSLLERQPQKHVEEFLLVNEQGYFVVREIIFTNITQPMFDFIYNFRG